MSADALDLLRTLVRTRSVSGSASAQASIQDAAAAFGTADGTATVVRREGGDLPWMLLSTDPGDPGGVLFVCHTDTVPLGEPRQWSFDPIGAEIEDDVLHGRGSVDMKGGLVAALHALRTAGRVGATAHVLLTSDEEIGCQGANAAAPELRLEPALVVVPEATRNRVSLGHRGATWLRVEASGRPAHGSTPHLGVNAIRLLADHVLARVDSMPLTEDPYLGPETVNVGTISGGNAPNIVPESASLTLDVRTVGGGESVLAWAGNRHPEIAAKPILDLPAVKTPRLPESLRGYETAPGVAYFTDASALVRVFPAAPFVVWGPGDPAQMHATNERLELASWRAALDAFDLLVGG